MASPMRRQAERVQVIRRGLERTLDAEKVALLNLRRVAVVEVVELECFKRLVELVNKVAQVVLAHEGKAVSHGRASSSTSASFRRKPVKSRMLSSRFNSR